MKNTLPYEYIIEQKYFDSELKKIFLSSWVFGCLWTEIRNKGYYRVVSTPFGEILITSDGEKPSAFFNKCLHRGHRLASSKRGSGELICPYHGWQYDTKGQLLSPGVLMHIPGDKKFYNVAKELYSNKRIQEVKATKIGDLVFINASSHPDPISEQFDNDVINSLQLTEKKLSDTFLEASIELNFNWKLIFENLRDGLHPLYLHKSTLTKEVDFGFTKNYVHREKKKIERISEISSFSRDGKIKQTDAPHKRNFQLIDDKNMYLNWLLYPYTHISSPDGGALIGIENYVPISSSKTRLDLTFCITKSLGRSSPLPILYKWFEKAALVFKEDFDAVTSIQRRAKESEMQQNIGEYENRNLSIFEWMKDEIYE